MSTIKAYKAFNHDWTCRGFKYEVGETYKHNGSINLCEAGFHACEAPLDVLGYYPPTAMFAEVELGEASGEKAHDTKRVGKSITVKAALSIAGLVSAQIEWVSKQADANISSGYNSKAASSGDNSKAASSGYNSKAASSGDNSTAASSGDNSTAASSGYNSTAASSGYNSKAASSGDNSTAASSGYNSKAASSGYNSTAASSGYNSKAASSGDNSTAEAAGAQTVAMVAGCNGHARAGAGGAFALAWADGEQMRIAVGIVGEGGIKPDTWYRVEAGTLVEVAL